MTEIERRLANYKVIIGTDSEGRIVAISDVEPAFCVVRNTEEEVKAVVHDIIVSYVKVFFNEDIREFSLEPELSEISLPISRVEPKKSFLPSFGAIFGREHAPVAVGC